MTLAHYCQANTNYIFIFLLLLLEKKKEGDLTPSPNFQPLPQQPAGTRDSLSAFSPEHNTHSLRHPLPNEHYKHSLQCCAFFVSRFIVRVGLLFFFRLQSGGRGGAVGGRLIKEEPAAACSQPFWRKAFNTAARQRSKPLSRHWEGDSITILLEPPCLKPSQKKKEKTLE